MLVAVISSRMAHMLAAVASSRLANSVGIAHNPKVASTVVLCVCSGSCKQLPTHSHVGGAKSQ
jgi:hypothetical protein